MRPAPVPPPAEHRSGLSPKGHAGARPAPPPPRRSLPTSRPRRTPPKRSSRRARARATPPCCRRSRSKKVRPLPGFYGSDANIANRHLAAGRTQRQLEQVHLRGDRPPDDGARRESRAGDQFKDFRESTNVEDRRLAPPLTDAQRAQYQAVSPRGKFSYTPAEHEAAQAQADTPLAKALGQRAGQESGSQRGGERRGDGQGAASTGAALPEPTKAVEVPQAAAEAATLDPSTQPAVQNEDGSISTVRTIGMNVDGKETVLPTVSPRRQDRDRPTRRSSSTRRPASTSASTTRSRRPARPPRICTTRRPSRSRQRRRASSRTPQRRVPQPQVTPEMAKALTESVKDQGRPPGVQMKPPPMRSRWARPPRSRAARRVRRASCVAGSAREGLADASGGRAGMPGSQGGGIAMLGLMPMARSRSINAVFSTPLLESVAQAPQIGRRQLAPIPWQDRGGWGWGGGPAASASTGGGSPTWAAGLAAGWASSAHPLAASHMLNTKKPVAIATTVNNSVGLI